MDSSDRIIDIALHLDRHLSAVIQQYGLWTYAILFVVIFCETGLVVMPFLPGDSLLFAAGTFAALGSLKIGWLILRLSPSRRSSATRSTTGSGTASGPRSSSKDEAALLQEGIPRPDPRASTRSTAARRSSSPASCPSSARSPPSWPASAGCRYGRFLAFNVVGGIGWVLLLTGAGYFFGTIPFVKKNYSVAVLAIIAISTVPIVVEYLRHRKESPRPSELPGFGAALKNVSDRPFTRFGQKVGLTPCIQGSDAAAVLRARAIRRNLSERIA